METIDKYKRFVESSIYKKEKINELYSRRRKVIDDLIFKHNINDLLDELENNFNLLKDEFYKNVKEKQFIDYPVLSYTNGGWKVTGINWRGCRINQYEKQFPLFFNIIDKYRDLIQIAGYSVLEPNSVIFKHRDDDEMITCHLPLKIPQGDCRFKIGDHLVKYTEGKSIMFYSNDLHEAWNKTNEQRVILLVELKEFSKYKKTIRKLIDNKLVFFFRYKLMKLLFKPRKKLILQQP